MIKFLSSITKVGRLTDDNREIKVQRLFLIYLTIFMCLGGLIWGTIALAYQLFYQSLIPFGYVIISILNITYLERSDKFNTVRVIQLFMNLTLPFIFQWSLGGFLPSGMIMLWALLSLIASVFFQDFKSSIASLTLFVLLTAISGIYDNYFHAHLKPEILADFSLPFTILNICVITIIISGLIIYFVNSFQKVRFDLRTKKGEINKAYLSLKEAQSELKIKNKQLEKANNAKSDFLATVSHEIRTPLNGIIGISDILEKTSLSQEQKNLLEHLQHSSTILHSLINDVLDVTQFEDNRLVLTTSDFNLENELRSLVEILKLRLAEKSELVSIRFLYDKSLPKYVNSDLTRLKQVLINLVSNSIKFTQSGYIDIRVFPVSKDQDSVTIKFQIDDTGIGISPAHQKQLFEKFFRAKETSEEGSGLGLTISKNIVEVMGGNLEFNSTHGKESSFFFQIPFKICSESKQAPAPEERVTVHEKQIEVLVAEDNAVNKMIIDKMLKNLGFKHICIVENGKEALKRAIEKEFDLILMDINMPEMGGLEATKKIFTYCDHNSLVPPVIGALTANAFKHDVEEYLAAGMSFVLSKPFSSEALSAAIKESIK